MAAEYLLVIAGACLAGVAALAARDIRRYRLRQQYEGRHTGEQAVVHTGVTETSPLIAEMPLAPPPPPIDPADLLKEAKAARVRLDREIADLEAQIAARDADQVHVALDALERSFRNRLARAGQRETPTAEWRRSDIRRIVRSGAPR